MDAEERLSWAVHLFKWFPSLSNNQSILYLFEWKKAKTQEERRKTKQLLTLPKKESLGCSGSVAIIYLQMESYYRRVWIMYTWKLRESTPPTSNSCPRSPVSLWWDLGVNILEENAMGIWRLAPFRTNLPTHRTSWHTLQLLILQKFRKAKSCPWTNPRVRCYMTLYVHKLFLIVLSSAVGFPQRTQTSLLAK